MTDRPKSDTAGPKHGPKQADTQAERRAEGLEETPGETRGETRGDADAGAATGAGGVTRRLPPLNALRAFEATARHANVARAAAELGVTPGAVSQQIRQLELLLGRDLFVRHARGVAPTQAAAAIAPMLSEGFKLLREASAALVDEDAERRVRIGAPPDFAVRWLAPRLEAFAALRPDLAVTIDSGPRAGALERFRLDLDISYGPPTASDGARARLMSESVVAAARADVWERAAASAGGPGAGGGDARALLAHAPLLHADLKGEDPSYPDWAHWLRARGVERIGALDGDRLGSVAHVIEAAELGRGAGLMRRALAQSAFDAGRLVPLTLGGVQALEWGYAVSWLDGRGLARPARALRDFLIEEAAPVEHMGV